MNVVFTKMVDGNYFCPSVRSAFASYYGVSVYRLTNGLSYISAFSTNLLKSGTVILKPGNGLVRGHQYWYGSDWAYYATNDRGTAYCLIKSRFPGYIPSDSDDGYYIGDPPLWGSSSTQSPTGSLSGSPYAVLEFYLPRWEKIASSGDGLAGEYLATDGESGRIFLGQMCWKLSGGRGSVSNIGRFGECYYEGGQNEIGYRITPDSNGKWRVYYRGYRSFWWEGEEPSETQTVVYKYRHLESYQRTHPDVSLTYAGRKLLTTSACIYLGEVPVWH